jgi:serine O-acetyltransferase
MRGLYKRLVLFPLVVGYRVTDRQDVIDADVERWRKVQQFDRKLIDLLCQPPFRSLFYHRMKSGESRTGRLAARLLAIVYRPQSTLYLETVDIGPGLYIQHGFATIVAAKAVGANCWINQQVTIGYDSKLGQPVLEDGVIVNAGAKIIGAVIVGANSTVGANAVVVRDVPPNGVAVGVPAHRAKIT